MNEDDMVDSPAAWYDDDHAGCWWGLGHMTPEEFIEAASEYDGDMTMESLEGYTLEHCWRSNMVDGCFDISKHQSEDFPHPITKLV